MGISRTAAALVVFFICMAFAATSCGTDNTGGSVFEIVVVIDDGSGMAIADREEEALDMAVLIIRMLEEGSSRAGIVFGGEETETGLVKINERNKNLLTQDLDDLSYKGGHGSIDKGLNAASAMFERDDLNTERVVVLFTDGVTARAGDPENEALYINSINKAAISLRNDLGASLYVVGLGGDRNSFYWPVLTDAAGSSENFIGYDKPADLAVFLVEKLSSSVIPSIYANTINDGSDRGRPWRIPIPAGTEKTWVMVFKDKGAVSSELIVPTPEPRRDGQDGQKPMDLNVFLATETDLYDLYRIDEPKEGEYRMEIEGDDFNEADVLYINIPFLEVKVMTHSSDNMTESGLTIVLAGPELPFGIERYIIPEDDNSGKSIYMPFEIGATEIILPVANDNNFSFYAEALLGIFTLRSRNLN